MTGPACVRPSARAAVPGGPAGAGPAGRAGRRPAPAAPAASPRGANDRHDPCDALAAGFAALFLEVEAGCRPRRQLAPFMTPLLYARLCEVWFRPGTPGSVVRVRGAAVAADRYEAVAVVRRGRRCAAVALRLVRTPAGWRVDEVARPEDGPLPPAPFTIPDDEPDSFALVDSCAQGSTL